MSDPPPDAASALQAQLDALHAEQTRAQLESEQALHDLAAKLSAAEADLARTRDEVKRAQEETQRERTRAEDAERREREAGEQRRGDDAGKEDARRRAEQAEREKADLLAVIDKEQADKRSLEGEPFPSSRWLTGRSGSCSRDRPGWAALACSDPVDTLKTAH